MHWETQAQSYSQKKMNFFAIPKWIFLVLCLLHWTGQAIKG